MNLKEILDQIARSQLTGISMEPSHLWLRLDFTQGPSGKDIKAEFFNVIHIRLSKSLDDEDSPYVIGNAELQPLEDGGHDLLRSLKYGFKSVPALDSNRQIFHFKIEGDICIDIISSGYKFFAEI